MSRRALRRLRGEQRGQEPLGPGALQFVLRDDEDAEEEGPKRGPAGRRPGDAGKEGVRVNNRFELVRSGAVRGGGGGWVGGWGRSRDVTGGALRGPGRSGRGGAVRGGWGLTAQAWGPWLDLGVGRLCAKLLQGLYWRSPFRFPSQALVPHRSLSAQQVSGAGKTSRCGGKA